MTMKVAPSNGDTNLSSTSGQMASLIGAHAWASSAPGEADKWSQQLATLVGVILGSKQPMFVAWGREQTLIYMAPTA